ncbi:MAG: orotate phosphoribosyltransferase [Myxococcales bacterium]|nr:MAG: orotate phosphoribosyltransferase [Myxococcales bacterium]
MSRFVFPPAFPSPEADRARLLELLKRKSYVEGEVTLASGKKSDFYIDCRQTSLDAEGAALIGRIFHQWIAELPEAPDAIGGMTMGADPLVTATSLTSFLAGRPIPGFLIRKEPKGHGMGKQIEGAKALQPGMRVLLLEDVVTTGGSTLKAVEACEREGLAVGGVFCLVDRLEGGREAVQAQGLPLAALYTRRDFKG